MMMARNFENGLYLIHRCQTELVDLARCLRAGGEQREAVDALIEAAERADLLFSDRLGAPAANENARMAR